MHICILFTKGPKYQENKTISFEKAKLDFTAGLNKSVVCKKG